MNHAQRSHRRDSEDDREDELPPQARSAELDPLLCQMALYPGAAQVPAQSLLGDLAPSLTVPMRAELQHLIVGLARRVAWGGDRRRGSARIEFSEGALAGAILVVHSDERSVTVDLELPSGVEGRAGNWQQRILDRLQERGFSARVSVQ